MRLMPKKLSSFQIIFISFASIILLGALLLMLPFATASGKCASFDDALFTAVSATCVTGLVVQDTATYWSGFGHVVIMCLIQVGGLGIVTVAVSIAYLSGKAIGLKQRSTMQEAVAAHQVGGVVKLTKFILVFTLIVELSGAILLAPVLCKDFGLFKGLWYSIFHSISAYCNAGFDLMGINAPYSSLTGYVDNPLVNTVISTLIIFGGLGFITWNDIVTHKFKVKRYHMQSKVVLLVTTVLLILPAIYFYINEFDHLHDDERAWASVFQSVTARTAGFNTVDLNTFSGVGVLVMISLMLVGGSPGSTAGGMKTTTLAVMLSNAVSVFKRKEHAQFFGRRAPEEATKNASTIFIMYIALFLISAAIISHIEGLPLDVCLFETASAIGTVGISLGITPQLCIISKAVLMVLMFFGRVGGLTLIFAATGNARITNSKLPQEKITVG